MEVEKVKKTDLNKINQSANLEFHFQNCGFITFEKSEAAEKAILEQNGTVVGNIELKVKIQRFVRQINTI